MLNTQHPRQNDFDGFGFFEMAPDLVCVASREGLFKKVNPAVIHKLGYTQEELFSKPISSFIHPDDREVTRKRRTRLLKGEALLNFENRYLTKNGNIIWLEWTSIYLPDKEVVFAIAKDVTERKQIEREVLEKYEKFKNLATHFKSTIEEDRKYLATELHEQLAQLASVIKMDVDWIKANSQDLPATSKSRIEHALVVSELLITTIQRIAFSISPGMLDDIGLNATLEWHCREFSILNRIPCRLEISYDESDLPKELKIDLFRICQEALTNVMNHANARNVNINVTGVPDQITLTITDDGKGFDVWQQGQIPSLTRIMERAASINGKLIVNSELGKGTKVCVIIPR
jgi:PAS domain S-box-containing protein